MQLIDNLVDEVLNKRKFVDLQQLGETSKEIILKDGQNTTAFDVADVSFVQQCNKESKDARNAPAVLQRIYDKKLTLIDYQLNWTVVKAVKAAVMQNPHLINVLYLDNCGLDDEKLATILEGCSNLNHFMSLKLRNQEFD